VSAAGIKRMACEEPWPPAIGQVFNPYRRFPGTFIPEQICKYKGLSPGAKLVYGRLCRYAGKNGAAYPALNTLGAETGLGETQVRCYLKELEREQFIAVDRENRHYRKDGSGGSNGYLFLWHIAFTGDSGERRKAPPPLRRTEGVPLRKTEPLTPAENRTRRESGSRESVEESQSTSDYQPTNRKNRDSHAGQQDVTDGAEKASTAKPRPTALERKLLYTVEEREWLSNAIGVYGQRRTMRAQMGEDPPRVIVQQVLEAADGVPVQDIFAFLRHLCFQGCEPGTSKGPHSWGWFPKVIANAIESRREQEAAAADLLHKEHASEYCAALEADMARAMSAFSTLDADDLEATP